METDLQMDGAAAVAKAAQAPLAATWRRWLAFLIDWIILSLGGYLVGAVLFDTLARLGPWSRVIGLIVAVTYFGIADSGWGGASSPGKKVLGIRVVDEAGRVIGMGRSFLRASIICAPLILNQFFIAQQGEWGHLAVNGLLGGWMLASFYVLAFNQATKQGLHDLATHTYVIRGRATRQSLAGYMLWRPHMVIAAVLLAISVPMGLSGIPVFLHFSPGPVRVAEGPPAPSQGSVQVVSTLLRWKSTDTGRPGECMFARIQLAGPGVNNELVARGIAMRLVAQSHCQVVTNLDVRMQYGFDMGFSSGTAYRDFVIDEADLTRQP